jgi:hypothetical protein
MKIYSLLPLLIIAFTSCKQSVNPADNFTAVKMDSAPGSCPYLTRDHNNNVVLSWVKQTHDSAFAFTYAVSVNGGQSFQSPIVIPSSNNVFPHSENIPKIIFKPSGEIIAVWGASNPNPINKYSGLVYYSQSFDSGKSWTDAKRLVNDTSSYDQRYFDVALMPDGEAGIIWLDNRKTINKEGAAIYFATSKNKDGFQNGTIIGQPTCECCRVDLFVDKSKNIHVAYRAILNDSIRDIVHSVSTDSGRSFSKPAVISTDNWMINACPHTGPSMTESGGRIHFAWYTMGAGTGIYHTSTMDNGKTFEKRSTIIENIGRHPQISSITDNTIIAWDELSEKDGKMFTRICLHKAENNGNKVYLTEPDGYASYPTLQFTNSDTAIVSYTKKDGDSKFIYYGLVNIR